MLIAVWILLHRYPNQQIQSTQHENNLVVVVNVHIIVNYFNYLQQVGHVNSMFRTPEKQFLVSRVVKGDDPLIPEDSEQVNPIGTRPEP